MITVSVIFTRPVSFSLKSWLIMKVMGTDYSHCAIYFEGDLYQAIGSGVERDVGAKYLETHEIVKSRTVDLQISRDFLLGLSEGEKGKDYSQTQLFLILLKMPWLSRILSNGSEKMICSEYVARLLMFSEFRSRFPENLDLITPKDLVMVLFGQEN